MDPFMNDGYDLSYDSNPRFSQSERTYINHAQASEVRDNMLNTKHVLISFSVNFSAFWLRIVCYCDCLS
jgi:hypothetical protein